MGVQDRDWYWRGEHDEKRAFRSRERGWASHPVSIVLVVIVGAFVVWGIQVAVIEWRARVAAEQIIRAGNEAMRRSQIQMQQAQREATARERHRLAAQGAARMQEAANARAIAERQQAREEARRAAADATARKDKAWASFYRKPAHCADTASVECANDYIRARRNFEAKYARGEL